MAERPVHWHEGMFLGPQHLQAAQRYDAGQRHKFARAAVRHNWGLYSLQLNQTALANYRFEVQSLRAFLRDGTLVDIPDDGSLSPLDLREALQSETSLTVFLALPSYRMRRANAAEAGQPTGVRFQVETQDVEDENTGSDPQPIRFRLLNLKLVVGSEQEHAGYDLLPIARVGKSAEADTTPRLDVNYIPPLLGCEAWQPLQIGILRTIYDRIGTKIDLLAEQVESRGISLESQVVEDIRILGQLRVLNEAYTVLGILAFTEGIHPLEAYTELCRIVGQLCIFGGGAVAVPAAGETEEAGRRVRPYRPPDLPRYDHDDLGYCFYQVKKYLDSLLNVIIEPEWQARPFRGVGLRMQVALEPVWLESAWLMFVAVESRLTAEQCVNLFTTAGMLDMKIGSSDRVDRIFEFGQAGLAFTHRPQPRSLPARAGLTYFQVDRTAQPAEWQHVKRSMTLAVRVNERLVSGSIDGAESLTILHAGKQVPVRFILYITRPQAPSA
jgi:type VI secretion system protein ImpJ